MKLMYIDLFCGAGGTSTGVEKARYNDLLSLRFRFDAADRLKQLPAWLKSIKAPVNELAPTIIRQNVTAKNLNIKIVE